jgi:hypothetical protein
MKFSDRFLSAIGGWQRGWREDKNRRLVLAEELNAAAIEENLPIQLSSAGTTCYRKRFLVPNNPQNGGDLGPLFLNGFIDEGLASWTTDKKFAQDFKDPLRSGTFAAVFAHFPQPGEVLVNIPALWADPAFNEAVKALHARGGSNADALMYFKFRQGEIVMTAPLKYEELAGICGKSSPFDVLCEAGGLTTDEERDDFWKKLVEANRFPEEPTWLTSEATRAVLDRARTNFLDKHGSKIADVIKRRSRD